MRGMCPFMPPGNNLKLPAQPRLHAVGFGLLMGVLAIILFKIGLSLGWVYLFMVSRDEADSARR